MAVSVATLGLQLDSSGMRTGLNDLKQVERAGNRAADALDDAGNRGKKATDSLARGFGALKAALATLGVATAIKQVVSINDEYARITGRLKLVTSGTEQLAKVQEDLFGVAQRTGAAYADTAALYTRVAQNAKDLGLTQQQLIAFTETTAQAFQVSGASAEEAAGAIRQLTQGLAAGALRGDEFNTVAEAGPRIMQALADSLGVARGELREMAADGKITADIVIEAMRSQGQAIASEFEKLPRTVSRAMTELENEVKRAIAGADVSPLTDAIDDLKETLADPGFVQGIADIAGGLIAVAKAGTEVVTVGLQFKEEIFAAALIAGAVAAGRYASGLTASAAASLASITTTRAHAVALAEDAARSAQVAAATEVRTAAEVAAMRAVVASTLAEVELEKVRLAAQISEQGRTATINRMAAASITLANAQRGLAAAEAELAAATAATAAAQTRSAAAAASLTLGARAAAGAAGLMRGALALVGGPAGAAVIAGLGLVYLISQMESAEERAERLAGRLRELRGEFNSLGATKELEETQQRIASIDKQISALQEKLIGRQMTNAGGQGALDRFFSGRESDKLKELSEERAQLLKIEAQLEDNINGVNAATTSVAEATEALTGKTEDLTKEQKKQYERIQDMIQAMEEEYILTDDLTEAEKVRISLANGYYGVVSAGQAAQLQALADLKTARDEDRKKTEEQLEAQKKLREFAAFELAQKDYLDTSARGYRRELDNIGMGSAARRYTSGANQIEDQFLGQRQNLNDQLTRGDITQDQFDKQLAVLGDYQQRALAQWDTYYARLEQRGTDFTAGFQDVVASYLDSTRNLGSMLGNDVVGAIDSATQATSRLAAETLLWGKGGTEAAKAIARGIITDVVSSLIRVGIQYGINAALQNTAIASTTAAAVGSAGTIATAQVGANSAIAASAAPAAAATSLASFGTNIGPALAAIAGAYAAARIFNIGFEEGGYTGNYGTKQVAGVVHGQEYVMNAEATRRYRGLLDHLNAGGAPTVQPIRAPQASAPMQMAPAPRGGTKIINAWDQGDFRSDLLDSDDADEILVNRMSRNGARFRAALGLEG